MNNIDQTAQDILNRCKDATLEDGWIATEELLGEKDFVEHVWTNTFKVEGKTILHEFYIISKRSGIVRLEMTVKGDGIERKTVLLAEFYLSYLTTNVIAKAMEAIISRS